MKKTLILGFSILLIAGFFMAACQNNGEGGKTALLDRSIEEGWLLLDSYDCHPYLKIEEITDLYHVNSSKGFAEWNEAIKHFTTEDGKYTDDFGGVSIDENGIFNILMVGNREPVKSDYFVYRQVSNSYNFLESIMDELTELTSQDYTFWTIWTISLCGVCNKVFISLENENRIQPIIEHLKIKKLFKRDTLSIFVGENHWRFPIGEPRAKDFPSVLEEFVLEEFTEDFFESNTLVLVPFLWPHLLHDGNDNLSFYTVFVENGILNFLIEIPNPDWGGDAAIDERIFAVIIPNQIINKYEIGGSRVFEAYEYHGYVDGEQYFTQNSREWLERVEKTSVTHRVSYALGGYRPYLEDDDYPYDYEIPTHLKPEYKWQLLGLASYTESQVVVISSVESLQEYFYVSAK